MDGEEGVVDLRIARAWILLFNELNHGPDIRFMRSGGGKALAAEALAEALAETELVGGGEAGMVEVVIGVGVKQAVGEDGGSEFHGLTEKSLQSAGGPGIAAGLDSVFHGESGVKAARPAG